MSTVSKPTQALSSKYYTDPTLFEKEKSTLLATTWQFACHVSEIPKRGDYFAFEIAGESLFVIRGKNDAIRTFYNVCMHRAHEMVLNQKGNSRSLVCPYHHWSYELDGALRAGPNLNAVEGLNKNKFV
ncbi:Rieske 2Fe-2S domain protein [Vibrio astriarenae]|nr:Rieske 2Fe-2S domain protein [Vibrio sp. C7]